LAELLGRPNRTETYWGGEMYYATKKLYGRGRSLVYIADGGTMRSVNDPVVESRCMPTRRAARALREMRYLCRIMNGKCEQ